MSEPFGFSGVNSGSMGAVGTPNKLDDSKAAAMRAKGTPVAEIADHFGVSQQAVYAALQRHRTNGGTQTPSMRARALRPWDFSSYGTGPGASYTWKHLNAAATFNIDSSALSAAQRAKMLAFVRTLRAADEVVVFTGQPPRFFDRKPRTEADGDLMIRTDGPLSDEQRQVWRLPDDPDAGEES